MYFYFHANNFSTKRIYKVIWKKKKLSQKAYAEWMLWKTFGSWLLWYHLFFENVDVPCIIKPQIISISKAVLVVSLKGKRENESLEMCNMQEIQSNWSRTLIAKQSPLSEPLNLTMPHLIWSWQLRVYLHYTEIQKTLHIPSTVSF